MPASACTSNPETTSIDEIVEISSVRTVQFYWRLYVFMRLELQANMHVICCTLKGSQKMQ